MVNAGASIEAYLRLNATDFREGLETAETAVKTFKESMLDVGKQGSTLTNGMNQVSKAITNMIRQMELLNTVDDKSITKLKQLGLALEHIATGAQRLGADARRGGEGLEMLNTVMDIFQAGMSSAEVTINATVGQLRNLKRELTSSKTSEDNLSNSTNRVRDSFSSARSTLMAMAQTLNGENASIMRVTNAMKQYEVGATNVKRSVNGLTTEAIHSREATVLYRKELMNLALGVEQYNKIQTSAVQREIRDLQKLQTALKEVQITRRLTNSDRMISITPSHTNVEQATAAIQKQSEVMRQNGAETLRNMGYKGRLSAEEAQVRANSYSSSTATQQYTNSLRQNTTATQRQATATKALGRAMSSLRMIGTMVGSMMVWNFAHNLITATRETVNAKSEMEGYFKMLNFGQRDIDHFNKALNDTVSQFQRVNKYSLGETISSIGVEFNLSTKEMEKAMKVTSMITSEYLRAGRNANEASLAVKDVLQGQFQRLSRETGVKGEQLKEAGWSGDTTDVLGLMEALEKVGMSRNWDVFAEKANSLNDIVTILQNRFGEWSAEMVNVVQPSIVSAFNVIMSVGKQLGGLLTGMWQWFNGDGLVETAVRWGTIATAIGTVTTALISYRTGANLVQIAQMGLRGSITATVLGLKAEEVATYGSRNAIISKITSLKAEEVATIGVRKALLAKALGLDTVIIKQKGLKGAIMSTTFTNQLYEASIRGASAEEMKAIYLEQQAQLSKMGTLRAIFAKIAGVNMETFAERGLIVALAQRVAESPFYIGALKAEEVAEMSTAKAALFLTATLGPLIAIFAALAIGVYALIKPLQDASEEMKKFNNLVQNGDDIIKDHKKSYDSLSSSYDTNKAKLDAMDKSSKKYARTQQKVKSLEKDKQTAYDNWQHSIEAVEMARSRQAKFDEEKDKIAIHNQTLLADAYAKVGFSARESSEMASHELNEAKAGAEQLRKALQMLKLEADKGAKKNTKMIDMLDQYGLSKKRIKEFGTNMSEAQYKISEGMEKLMTSDDLMERIGGWFEVQQGRFEEWWTELNAFFEVRDWDSIRDKLIEGLRYVLTGFGAFDWISMIETQIGDKGLIPTIMDTLFGEGDSDGVLDIIWSWANSMIIQPLGNWLIWFMEDPSAHFEEVTDDLSLSLAKFLFGKSETKSVKEITDEWLKSNIVKPLQDSINQLINDPIGFFSDEGTENVGDKLLSQIIFKGLFGENFSIKEYLKSLPDPVHDFSVWVSESFANFDKTQIQPILDGIQNFFSKIFSFEWLNNGDGGEGSGYSGMKKINVGQLLKSILDFSPDSLAKTATDIVNLFKDALINGIKSIPVVGSLADLLGLGGENQDVQTEGQEVGTNFTTGIQTGIAPLDGILNSAFNLTGVESQFTTSTSNITSNASSTATNVNTSFNNMKNNQKLALDSMGINAKTSFENIKNNSSTTLSHMRDTTSQVTSHVKSSFSTMASNIMSSSSKMKTNTSNDFSVLSGVIGAFYRNIQNPSNWGAIDTTGIRVSSRSGAGVPTRTSARKPLAGRRAIRTIGGSHGAGVNPYSSSSSKMMSIRDLVDMVGVDEKVPIDKFLSMFSGGFGAWSFDSAHRNYVKNTAYGWNTAPASITGIGQVGHGYTVGKWKNGSTSFSWDDFESTASSVFSAIPYKFYYDSEWKGNWVSALLSGAVNCSDGADAIIALARVFGFDGYKQHTTLANGVGHFFAVINGRKMDTTNFQQHGSWSPLGGAGIPTRSASYTGRTGETQGKTVNVTVDMSNSTIYGVDDLDERIAEGVDKGMQKHMNDPFTVAI